MQFLDVQLLIFQANKLNSTEEKEKPEFEVS